MKVKQVVVIRRKYPDGKGGTTGLRQGKTIAQACHASLAHMGNKFKDNIKWDKTVTIQFTDEELAWWIGNFAKICTQVDTEEELMKVYEDAKEAGLTVELITDSGLTEFHGQPTKTCLAIGPNDAEKIDKITGHLKLL